MNIKLGLLAILAVGIIIISGCTIPQAMPQQGISYSVSGCLGDAWEFLATNETGKPPYKMTAEITGDAVKLYKKQAHYCGAEITIEMQKEGDLIKLIESNNNPVASCKCLYDVNVTLTGLEPEYYKIELWGVKELASGQASPIGKLDVLNCNFEDIEQCKSGHCCCPEGMLCD